METSTERILTTHTGSLPRPASLTARTDPEAVRAAVAETVYRQRDAGVDVVNDGEVSKPSYATYVTERLTGFDGEPVAVQWHSAEIDDFPEYFERLRAQQGTVVATPPCTGPVEYRDRTKVEADIANLKAAADPKITWAKLAAMAEGARLASDRLWGRAVP